MTTTAASTASSEDPPRSSTLHPAAAVLIRGVVQRHAAIEGVLQETDRRIVLGAKVEKGALVTSVKDAGPGISPENQTKIFRRFFTQRPPGAPPGTGLGLSIVESVARAHGAKVAVESQPGQGATFRVVLPL